MFTKNRFNGRAALLGQSAKARASGARQVFADAGNAASTSMSFFYLLHCAWWTCIGVLETLWTPNNAIYLSWPTVAYCAAGSWNTDPRCTNTPTELSPIVHSTATTYSSAPLWVPIGFACFTAAAVYLAAAVGEGFIVAQDHVPDQPTDDCLNDGGGGAAEGGDISSPFIRRQPNDPTCPPSNEYSGSVLFFARFFTLPVMSAIVCVSVADKSVSSVTAAMVAALALNWLSYVSQSLYAWIYVDVDACKGKITCPDLWCVLAMKNIASVIGILWLVVAISLFMPICTAYALVRPESVPTWIRACFGLYLGLLSSMALYVTYDLICVARSKSRSTHDVSRGARTYAAWCAFAHVLHSVCAGLFLVFAQMALGGSGFIAF